MAKDRLPFLAEAEESLEEHELEVLKQKYEREGSSTSTSQTKFEFSWALIRSSHKRDQTEGVRFMTQLYETEPSMRREAGFYLALGHYKLGNFSKAREFNDLMLETEPKNIQAKALKDMLETKLAKGNYPALIDIYLLDLVDGTIGMFIVGGLVAVAGIATAMIFKKS